MIIKKAEDVEKLREKKPKQENKKYIVYLTESQENIPEKKNKSKCVNSQQIDIFKSL